MVYEEKDWSKGVGEILFSWNDDNFLETPEECKYTEAEHLTRDIIE